MYNIIVLIESRYFSLLLYKMYFLRGGALKKSLSDINRQHDLHKGK